MPTLPNQADTSDLPVLGSKEYREAVARIERELVRKFAWTAQHDGIVYRDDPACIRPMDDKTFNRVSRFGHSFPFVDRNEKRQTFFYRMQDIVAVVDDPALDIGFVFAELVDFLPNKPPVTKDDMLRTVLNLWRKPPWPMNERQAEPTMFTDHVRYLFDGDEIATGHLLSYIAHILQRPEQRVNHALLITSEAKGIGKSTLGTIIRRLVGERNSSVAQTKDLKSQFDGWLMGKLVIQVDEIYEYGNWELANRLKPLLTEETISVNVKYGPQLTVRNYARFIIFSNHTAPIDLEEGDRRYFVVDSPAKPREAEYYERLHDFIDSTEGMATIYNWLMQRDLTGFKPFAPPPVTRAKEKIIESSGNPLYAYIANAVSSGHMIENLGPEFTLDAVQRLLHRDGFGAHARSTKELGVALREAGIEHLRVSKQGGRKWVYRLPGFYEPASAEPEPEF